MARRLFKLDGPHVKCLRTELLLREDELSTFSGDYIRRLERSPWVDYPILERVAQAFGVQPKVLVTGNKWQICDSDRVPVIGSRVRDLRNSRGLTVDDVCRQTGLSERELEAMEDGRLESKYAAIKKIARLFGVEPGELIQSDINCEHQAEDRTELEIKINGDPCLFCEREFTYLMKIVYGIDVEIIPPTKPGSVCLTVEVPTEQVDRLEAFFAQKRLSGLDVAAITRKQTTIWDEVDWEPESSQRNPSESVPITWPFQLILFAVAYACSLCFLLPFLLRLTLRWALYEALIRLEKRLREYVGWFSLTVFLLFKILVRQLDAFVGWVEEKVTAFVQNIEQTIEGLVRRCQQRR